MLPETDSFSSEDSVFHQLYKQARLLYNFASLMTTHSNHKNCSELAPTLTMAEVHLLVDIMEPILQGCDDGWLPQQLAYLYPKFKTPVVLW